MKKNTSKHLLTKQPILKNVSLIGTTMMISSSVLIPGMTTKAYAEATKETLEEVENQAPQNQGQAMELARFETSSLAIKEESNLFDMDIVLNARQLDNLDTVIQVSPNVNLVMDETKTAIKDELGNIVGSYELDQTLNQIKITFTESGFTQAKLVVPTSLKKFDLSEQVVTLSIGESMLSQTITAEKQANEIEETEEITSEEVTTSESEETQATSTENTQVEETTESTE